MTKDVDIQIVGTSQDVRLLKRILNFYRKNKATENEKHHIDTYIGLIDRALEKAEERDEAQKTNARGTATSLR